MVFFWIKSVQHESDDIAMNYRLYFTARSKYLFVSFSAIFSADGFAVSTRLWFSTIFFFCDLREPIIPNVSFYIFFCLERFVNCTLSCRCWNIMDGIDKYGFFPTGISVFRKKIKTQRCDIFYFPWRSKSTHVCRFFTAMSERF